MRYVFIALFGYFASFQAFAANKTDIQDALTGAPTPAASGNDVFADAGEGKDGLDALFVFITNSLSTLLVAIAIGMFLFIGFRLVAARGNPEEFSKAMKSFVFAIIGLFIVAAAWAVVRITAGLSINSLF
ncbi:pilin [Candidatus Gracilibacteria bacterium]|nr:pilin [Candidatus Gracilibacteria bacterium]